MTALDAFSLTPAQWEELEEKYRQAMGNSVDEMLVKLIKGTTPEQQKYFALGIMVGRESVPRWQA
jgi:hypothetical protein